MGTRYPQSSPARGERASMRDESARRGGAEDSEPPLAGGQWSGDGAARPPGAGRRGNRGEGAGMGARRRSRDDAASPAGRQHRFATADAEDEGYGGYTNRDIGGEAYPQHRELPPGHWGADQQDERSSAAAAPAYADSRPAEWMPPAAGGAAREGQEPGGDRCSDERIRDAICEQLMRMEQLDVSDVRVAVSEARVTLEGTVPERGMKHAIEDAADDCRGVKDVDNRIRVTPRAGAGVAGGQGAGTAVDGRQAVVEVARGQRKG